MTRGTMKVAHRFLGITLLLTALIVTSCCRAPDEVWDDTRTASRHMGRGMRSLVGKHGDSRQVCSREDFLRDGEQYCYEDLHAMEFEPIPDTQYTQEVAMAETRNQLKPVQQAHQEPGHPMSSIPGIEAFSDPSKDSKLAEIFKPVHFPYNSDLIKGKDNNDIIRNIADYMREHRDTYLFVEGHCDERGAEAYNLALGSRRSNSVRNTLIQEGVSPERLFTVSYGKERPVDLGHTEKAWAKNRRGEFKIYSRS